MEKCRLTYQGELTWRKSDVVWYAIDRTAWTEIEAGLIGYAESDRIDRQA
jgi:hypothetical protein